MKNKLFKLSVLLVVGLLVLSGCSKKESDKEVLVDSLNNSATMTSFESSFDITMELDAEVDVDPSNPFGDALSNISVTGTMKTDVTKSLFEMDLSTSLMGMGIEVHMLMDENILAIKAPFITSLMGMGDVYILSDVEDEDDIPDVRVDEAVQEINRIIKETVEETIDEKSIKTEDKATLETPEGSVDGQRINVDLSDKEIIDFINTLNRKMDDSDLLETDDDFEEEIDTDELQFDGSFRISFFVDKDNIVRSTDIDADLKNPENADESVNLKMNFMLWNINKNVEINMPTFDESNSIRLDEFGDGGFFFD